MDADLKRRWVEALRSGRYQQAKGNLRIEGAGHCCLGVLCDLVAPYGWEYDEGFMNWTHGGEEEYLPDAVRESAELPADDDGELESLLAEMNDGGEPFSVIADYIEATIPVEPSP